MVEGMKWMDYPLSEDTFLSSIREYTLATWWEELSHLKRPWCWERLRAGGEGDDRGWDGWMASPTQWTWVWVDSGSWWWKGRPGVLQFMGRKELDMTEQLNWTELKRYILIYLICIKLTNIGFELGYKEKVKYILPNIDFYRPYSQTIKKFRMGENNSKWSNWQTTNLKNIQATPTAQLQKNKWPNQKMGQRTN